MTGMRYTTITQLEVCTCCYMAAAGYSDHETGETHEFCKHEDEAPLSRWTNAPAITTGGTDSGDGDRAHDFAAFPCEGCGTPLAGERHYVTITGEEG